MFRMKMASSATLLPAALAVALMGVPCIAMAAPRVTAGAQGDSTVASEVTSKLDKKQFKDEQYLGSGGIGRFRNSLWAAFGSTESTRKWSDERLARVADEIRAKASKALAIEEDND